MLSSMFSNSNLVRKALVVRRSDRLEYNAYILVLFSHKMALLLKVI